MQICPKFLLTLHVPKGHECSSTLCSIKEAQSLGSIRLQRLLGANFKQDFILAKKLPNINLN